MARFGTYSENTSPADADLLVSVDVSDTTDDATGSTKRLSLSGLRTFFGASPTFTGTTTTAALTATDGILSSGSTGSSVPSAKGLEVINTNATSGEQRFKLSVTNAGDPRLDAMSDDGSSRLRNAFVARSDGEFRLTDNTSVSVPAATAATHAAQVSARDATYGQLAIGGVEMGDTGWRTVASWTAGVQDGASQLGTIDTGLFSLNGTGVMNMRRVGNTVYVSFPNSNANSIRPLGTTNATLFTSGVFPSAWYMDVNFGRFAQVSPSGGAYNQALDSAATLTNYRLYHQQGASGYFANFGASYLTAAAWSTSLPGVQLTAPA